MNRLREIRVIKRLSQFQLRVPTGIHQSKISMIENGLIEPTEERGFTLYEKLTGVRQHSEAKLIEEKFKKVRNRLEIKNNELDCFA